MLYVFVGLSAMYFVLAFILTEKNSKTLLSGYNTLSPEEQEKVDIVPFLSFFKKFHIWLGITHLVIGGVLFFLFGNDATIYFISFYPLLAYGYFLFKTKNISKWQSEKSYISGIVVLSITVLLISILFLIGNEKNTLYLDEGKIEISGMYGVELEMNEVLEVKLLDTIPAIKIRLNGFSTGDIHKGYYRTKRGEKVRLLIDGMEPPYLFIKAKGQVPIYFRPLGGLVVNEELKQLISDK